MRISDWSSDVCSSDLKRPPVLPAWANEHSATLHALQVDYRAQGKGYGKACLQALPAVARAAWPQIRGLELSVDADNDSAIGLYTRLGWVDSGEAYKGDRKSTRLNSSH